MTIAAIGVGVSAAGTIATASGGKGDEAPGAAAQGMYDPLGKDRQMYVDRLRKFMTGESDFTSNPAYKARFAAGQDAVASSAASRGLLDSGAMGIELQQKGQSMASEEYEAEFQRLATLAGGAPQQAGANRNTSANDAWSGVGGLFGAASNLYGRSTMGGGRGIFT